MFNRYSGLVLSLAIVLLLGGAWLLYVDMWWVFASIIFILGFLTLILGWKQLSGSNEIISSTEAKKLDSKPRQVGLFKILSKRTEVTAEGTIFVFDWIPKFEVVGVSVFDIVLMEEAEPFKMPGLLCKGGKEYVDAEVSIGFMPDINDDPVGTPGWKSAGKKLAEFDDAGGYEGVIIKLKSAAKTQAQYIATLNSRVEMEMKSEEISIELVRQLNGTARGINNPIVTAQGMGVIVVKADFNASSNPKIREAADKIIIEALQRTSEMANITTVDQQVDHVMRSFEKDKAKREKRGEKNIIIPDRKVVWDLVYLSRLADDGKTTRFEAGNLLHFHEVGGVEEAAEQKKGNKKP